MVGSGFFSKPRHTAAFRHCSVFCCKSMESAGLCGRGLNVLRLYWSSCVCVCVCVCVSAGFIQPPAVNGIPPQAPYYPPAGFHPSYPAPVPPPPPIAPQYPPGPVPPAQYPTPPAPASVPAQVRHIRLVYH